MTTEDIIRSSLSFLEKDYHLEFFSFRDRGNHYIFSNPKGRFEYFEWSQFQETRFCVYANEECKTIDMFLENPKLIGKFQQKNRGLKAFFGDNRKEYWKIIGEILRNEIEKNGTLFGLELER
jgi:hypothetical protein